MHQRPKSVTVVCWFLIISGVISLIVSTIGLSNPVTKQLMAKSPLPINVQYVMMYAGVLVSLVCGVKMLKGQNWARLLYVGWGIAGFLIALFTSPMKAFLIPGIVIFLIVAYILFRPKANEYFQASSAEHGS